MRHREESLIIGIDRRTVLPLAAAVSFALTCAAATAGVSTFRTEKVPTKLLGVWHKTMTNAQWQRAGVSREAGVYTFVVKKAGTVTVYKPGDYRPGCASFCGEDFTTTFTPTAGRLTLGSVPVCSFNGTYSWHLTGQTLVVTPVADNKCIVRATFFGGKWKR
jgi:hypothetical protein